MIYLDYSRKAEEWIPNKFGGRENLEAVSFLQNLNKRIYADFPDVLTIAGVVSAGIVAIHPYHPRTRGSDRRVARALATVRPL